MQIPMEILSNVKPRTDSGAEMRRKTFEYPKTIDFAFSKVLEKSSDARNIRKMKEIVGIDEFEETPIYNVRHLHPGKKDERAQETDDIVAGAMGIQSPVVFILEGDKENDTDLSISIDTELTVGPIVESGTAPEKAVENESENAEKQATPDANTETANAATTDEAAQSPGITPQDVKAAADTAKHLETETVDEEADIEGKDGEVKARTPNVGNSEQRENEENNSEFSEKGDLSPLENENDKVANKGHKGKTQSEIDSPVKNTEGDANGSVSTNTIPISESIKPERFMASEHMTRTANTPVKAENLFDEMVSRIEEMNSDSKQTVMIQLKPEFLGNVALEIAMDAAGLHVKISAEDNGVRSMINGQITALIESLQNKGIEVVEVEVAYTGVNDYSFKDSQNNQAQPERQRRSYRAVDDAAAYRAALKEIDTLEYYLDVGVSSVEYSA